MFKIDLHTHTIASGHAFGTIQENAREAKNKGIELLGISDHAPTGSGAPSEAYFRVGKRLPKEIEGVRVLFGVEANIISDAGGLDLPEKILERLDFVMAGFHDCCFEDQGMERNTEALVKAMQNPYVKIISHPYVSKFVVDMERIALESIKSNVLLEINASYFYKGQIVDEGIWNRMKKMVEVLKNNDQKILVGSDAHTPWEVGKFEDVVSNLKELGIDESDLWNDDVEGMLAFLGKE
ncbi:MAG: PHP domain-containing protein [Parcubacteria group bacterium]